MWKREKIVASDANYGESTFEHTHFDYELKYSLHSIHHLDRLLYFQYLLLDTCIVIHLSCNSLSFFLKKLIT